MIIEFVLIWLGIGIIADLLAAAWMFMVDRRVMLNFYQECGENPTEALERVTFIEAYKDMPFRMHAILIIAPFFLLKVLTYSWGPKE